MEVAQYINVSEVKRVCTELGIRDWTEMKEPRVSEEEARVILSEVNQEGMEIELGEFRAGLEVELEHGTQFPDANVTNNHPLLTGKIVLAHFKESLDYYRLLEVAEVEGDLAKAIFENNAAKAKKYYRKLAEAKIALSQAQLRRLA